MFFGHIFAGGYSAGYYSYLWAEVLSADAYAAFEEAGLDDENAVKELGGKFKDTVLAFGGGEHPADVAQMCSEVAWLPQRPYFDTEASRCKDREKFIALNAVAIIFYACVYFYESFLMTTHTQTTQIGFDLRPYARDRTNAYHRGPNPRTRAFIGTGLCQLVGWKPPPANNESAS